MSYWENELDLILGLSAPGSLKYQRRELIIKLIRSIEDQVEKSYGGCHKCFGKGYSTYNYGAVASPDFEGDRLSVVESYKTHMNFCTCERGKQLETLIQKEPDYDYIITQAEDRAREQERNYIGSLKRQWMIETANAERSRCIKAVENLCEKDEWLTKAEATKIIQAIKENK